MAVACLNPTFKRVPLELSYVLVPADPAVRSTRNTAGRRGVVRTRLALQELVESVTALRHRLGLLAVHFGPPPDPFQGSFPLPSRRLFTPSTALPIQCSISSMMAAIDSAAEASMTGASIRMRRAVHSGSSSKRSIIDQLLFFGDPPRDDQHPFVATMSNFTIFW